MKKGCEKSFDWKSYKRITPYNLLKSYLYLLIHMLHSKVSFLNFTRIHSYFLYIEMFLIQRLWEMSFTLNQIGTFQKEILEKYLSSLWVITLSHDYLWILFIYKYYHYQYFQLIQCSKILDNFWIAFLSLVNCLSGMKCNMKLTAKLERSLI